MSQENECKHTNYKLCFKLKQHTPIIHFQAEQKGATLRASELKPKLDRFLIDKVGMLDDEGKPKEKYKSWFIGGGKEHLALDYKVRIEPNNNHKMNKPEKGLYFGKSGQKEIDKFKIYFIIFQEELNKILDESFENFICIESFGTRNNKGFGSFTLTKTSEKRYKEILSEYYDFEEISDSETNPINYIKSYYQELKSGIGDPKRDGIYKDSKLMKYFYPKLLWEKQWIKKKIKEKDLEMFNDLKDDYYKNKNIEFDNDDKKYRYIRYLLGSSAGYTFITNKYSKEIQEIEEKEISDKEKRKLKKEAEKLKVYVSIKIDSKYKDILTRFKSPIFFKVFENKIYIAIKKNNPIDMFIYNKKFHFNAYYKNDVKNKIYLGFLETPSFTEFTQSDFKKFLFNLKDVS